MNRRRRSSLVLDTAYGSSYSAAIWIIGFGVWSHSPQNSMHTNKSQVILAAVTRSVASRWGSECMFYKAGNTETLQIALVSLSRGMRSRHTSAHTSTTAKSLHENLGFLLSAELCAVMHCKKDQRHELPGFQGLPQIPMRRKHCKQNTKWSR